MSIVDDDCARRVAELLESNNALLERARKAEARADGLQAALLALARTAATIAKELEREMDRNAAGERSYEEPKPSTTSSIIAAVKRLACRRVDVYVHDCHVDVVGPLDLFRYKGITQALPNYLVRFFNSHRERMAALMGPR